MTRAWLFLALAVWEAAVDERAPQDIAPFAIGLTGAFDILIGGVFTGAATNPVPWLGPALASGELVNSWVWTISPITRLVGAFRYEKTFLHERETTE